MAQHLELGALGEAMAADYLIDHGFTVLARNWRCRHGEIDIIAASGRTIVFVEVKTRSGVGYGRAAEAVTILKQGRLRRLAAQWLSEQSGPWMVVRFDVLAILSRRGYLPEIEHIEDAF